MFTIKKKKGDVCPICTRQVLGKNSWVVYHIKYDPQLVIVACKYCNYMEYLMRTNMDKFRGYLVRNRHTPYKETRAEKVLKFQKKFYDTAIQQVVSL